MSKTLWNLLILHRQRTEAKVSEVSLLSPFLKEIGLVFRKHFPRVRDSGNDKNKRRDPGIYEK